MPAEETTATQTAETPAPSTTISSTGTASYIDAATGNFDIRRLTDDRLKEQKEGQTTIQPQPEVKQPTGQSIAEPVITVGDYKIPQGKLAEMLSAFGGDIDALGRAVKNPDHIFRLVSKNWSPRVARAVQIEKENEELKKQLQARTQYVPPPQPIPDPKPVETQVPAIQKYNEDDQVFGEQNKAINQLAAQNAVLLQELKGLKGNVETAVSKNPATTMLITQQFDNLRKTHGDDVYFRAAQRIAQDVGFKVLEDGKIDMSGVAPEKMIEAIDHMNFYATTYKNTLESDETAIQAGLKQVPWVQGRPHLERSIRNNVMDECLNIRQKLGQYPDADHMQKLVSDAAIELEKEMDAVMAERARTRTQAGQPLGTGPTVGAPTSPSDKPLSAQDFIRPDGSFDLAAMNAEALRRQGA